MYRIVFLISSIFLLAECNLKSPANVLPYYNSPDFTPQFLSTKDAEQQIKHQIADFSLTNQEGINITQKNIEGKIHVANFFFSSCGSICPVMMKNLKSVADSFKNDNAVLFLSYSVTPWVDSVSRLKSYADNLPVNVSNWHLLTGKRAEIYTLARTSYFAEEDLGFTKDSSQFLHTEHILLIDKNKKIRGIYNGTLQLETQQLAKDIQLLKEEDNFGVPF